MSTNYQNKLSMAFEQGHEKHGGRKKGSTNKNTEKTKQFMASIPNNPSLKRKYLDIMKGDKLTDKQYIDAYHAAVKFSVGEVNKTDPTQKALPPITINLIAAQPQQPTLQESNIIDITHGEINPDSKEED